MIYLTHYKCIGNWYKIPAVYKQKKLYKLTWLMLCPINWQCEKSDCLSSVHTHSASMSAQNYLL